jgi:3-oxoacyl-[acyl-carrier protein] reductase
VRFSEEKKMPRFEDIEIGDRAEITHVVTLDDVDKFVALTGDDNKIHVDFEYAAMTFYKKPVVHGMLGAAFISTVIGTKLPGDGALWFSQSLEFLLPVRVGDTISVTAVVVKKNLRDNIIELNTDIFNQNKQKVTTGVAKVKIVVPEKKPEVDYVSPAKQKVALIIGASGGIGKSVAMRLAADGFDIALHYNNNEDAIKELRNSILNIGRRCLAASADLKSQEQIKLVVAGIVRHFGTITVLVNCATAKVANCKLDSLKWEVMQDHFDVNVRGSFFLVNEILPLMKAQRYGKVINFTTQYIDGTPPPELTAYVTAKSAIEGFSKSLAVEFAPFGITVNMVSPGMTDTDLIADIPEKTRLMTAAKTPLRRLARPDDISGAVSFLASEDANFITGETIRINGGQVML